MTSYSVYSVKLPVDFDGLKILQLSDLHSKIFGADNRRLVGIIDKLRPDIIVATGDMFNSTDDQGQVFMDLCRRLVGKYPVYYILGNHEQIAAWKAEDATPSWFEKYLNDLRKVGVVILDNDKAVISQKAIGQRNNGTSGYAGNDFIVLYGLTVPLLGYSNYENDVASFNHAYITKVLKQPDPAKFNILLAHTPRFFSEYVRWGADLVLSGHTHGGIVRVPFKGGLFSPEGEWLPKYDAGEFTMKGTTMIVNRGLGNFTVNVRLFNRPEISVIYLKRGNAPSFP